MNDWKWENHKNYVNISKYSKTIRSVKLTDNQRKLIDSLIFEMYELHYKLNQLTSIDYKFLLMPLLMIEGESSGLIEGTRTMIEDMSYDIEEINNIPQWETRNLFNLYEKYFMQNYHMDNFLFSSDSIANMHINLYEYNTMSKFKMVYDPSKQIQKVKPGKIIQDDSKPNFIGNSNNIEGASLILLRPSLKREYLDDLMNTISKRFENNSLLMDDAILMHPIFEAIHPFNDGNGRIGRLFLSMCFKFIYPELDFPIFISEAFSRKKKEYKELLRNVQLNNDYESWNQWISFFINALLETKHKMKTRANQIINLWKNIENTKATSTNIRKILQFYFLSTLKLTNQWRLII